MIVRRILFCPLGQHQYGLSYRVLTGKSYTLAYYAISRDCLHCSHSDSQFEAYCHEGRRKLEVLR